MNFWKISRSDAAPDGVIMVKVTPVNHQPLVELCRTRAGEQYQLNVGATLLLDIEFYNQYMNDLLGYVNSSFNRKELEVEPEKSMKEAEKVSKEAVIEHLKNNKRAIHKASKTSDSVYIFGEYKGKVYEYRESDHDKSHNSFSSITSLKECEYGVPVKIGSIFRNARVTYSTKFKTTTTDNFGNKESYLTSFVNEEMEKLK